MDSTLLELVISFVPGNVYWLDKNGVVLGTNDAQARAAGFKNRHEIVGKRLIDILPIEAALHFLSKNEEVIAKNAPMTFEEEVMGEDGSPIYYLSHKAPFWDKNELIGVIGVSLDITKERLLSQKLIQAEERAKTSHFLASVIAHELRTPLGAMGFMANSLTQSLPTLIVVGEAAGKIGPREVKSLAKIPERMGKVLYSSNQFIDMMLMMSTRGALKADLVEQPMSQVIRAALSAFPFMEGEEALVEVDTTADFTVKADLNLLEHLLFNLMKNSLYYLKAAGKGKIFIRTEVGPSAMNKLIFKDTGKGIAKEIIPNLFEPFFSRRHHGTGIGLAFCARIMEAHGGTISCDSIEGEYVTFEMTFPDNFERKK
jgi:PAS domain S-box-containing protein